MAYKDPTKQKEYQRKWIADRRAQFFIDKSCVVCGSTDQLELDHIDPTTKISNSIWSWSQKRQDDEIAKCQVLCHDHHVEKTWTKDGRHRVQHGSETMYARFKCRCELCCLARKLYKKNLRAKRKALGLPHQ
jgi:hypothetical protein